MDGKSLDITTEKLAQLKALFPEVFSEDKIDFQRLKIALGEDTFVKGEHYELSWAGKTEARKEIQKQTSATLNPQDAENLAKANNHLFIEGENLEVLRTLQKSYFGKVKMIYIDPPYNTGNDSFVYPDNFEERQKDYKERAKIVNENGDRNSLGFWQTNHKENGQFHSVWLSMMYPRLYLSRNLLKEDGVIFISIDDNEASNLKLLCDEVFGEDNFVGQLPTIMNLKGNNDEYGFSGTHEYTIVYCKNKKLKNSIFEFVLKEEEIDDYDMEDNIGKYKQGATLMRTGEAGAREKRPKGFYPIYVRNDLSSFSLTKIKEDDYEVYPKTQENKDMSWRRSPETLMSEKSEIIVLKTANGISFYKKQRLDLEDGIRGKKPKTLFYKPEYSSGNGTNQVKLLLGAKYFDNPKPYNLIKDFIEISTKPTENHIILDFFAGSGTTAQAVMELNEEDGGNRQFICVQMPEPTDENSEAHKAGYKTIADITKARIRKVIEKIAKERTGQIDFTEKALPICQNYTLADSNFKIWRSDIVGKEAIALQLFEHQQSEKEGDKHENLFVELCLKSGLGLNVVYKQENDFYKTEQGIWFCFEKYTAIQKEIILAEKPQKVVFLNSCFESDVALSNFQLELVEYKIDLVIV